MHKITITVGDVSLEAELNDSATAQQIWDALPITGNANVWGDEIYFTVPITADEATDARAEVEVGELGYWPPGNAFCIFYGPTPASSGSAPQAASPVNPVGRVLGDATDFRSVASGTSVQLEKAE